MATPKSPSVPSLSVLSLQMPQCPAAFPSYLRPEAPLLADKLACRGSRSSPLAPDKLACRGSSLSLFSLLISLLSGRCPCLGCLLLARPLLAMLLLSMGDFWASLGADELARLEISPSVQKILLSRTDVRVNVYLCSAVH